MNVVLFLSIIGGIMFPIWLAIGIYFLSWVTKLKKEGVETDAVVIRAGSQSSGPVVRYVTKNGETIEKKYSYSSSFLLTKRAATVRIKYNSAKPKSFWLVNDRTPYVLGIMMLTLSPVPILIPIFLAILM